MVYNKFPLHYFSDFTNFNTGIYMDSLARSAIMYFIKDFNLRKPDGVVSFDGTIDFYINGEKKTFESEVQVITSANIEAIYLINPEITNAALPDMFNSGKEMFMYVAGEYLAIQHEEDGMPFKVFIFPKQDDSVKPK